MSEQRKIDTNSHWKHRLTKRPIVVIHGNWLPGAVVGGAWFDGRLTDKVTYKYTDRKTRVMPCEMKVEQFLKTFAPVKERP